jgi:predicted DNA-binding transcriptional regulator AlpA
LPKAHHELGIGVTLATAFISRLEELFVAVFPNHPHPSQDCHMGIKASAPLLKEADVANALCVSLAAVRRWRTKGKGPRYLKLGSLVRYSQKDVSEWIQSRPVGGDSQGTSADQ